MVTITGTGFISPSCTAGFCDTVSLTFDGQPLCLDTACTQPVTPNSDGTGYFQVANVLVPGTASIATHTIAGAGALGGRTAATTFFVCQPSATGGFEWQDTLMAQGVASAPVIKTAGGQSMSYFSKGTTVYAVRNVAEGPCTVGDCNPGGIRWTWQAPATIDGTPLLGTVSGTDYVFFTSGSSLVRLKAADGTLSQAPVDTRRNMGGLPVCPTDTINASLISLVDKAGELIIYAITYNECSDTTHNRVLAFRASDLSLKWVLNDNTDNAPGSSPYAIAKGTSCVGDAATHQIFCGTLTSDPLSNSLFAIDSETGALNWATDAGPIVAGLALEGGRLYAAAIGALPSFAAYDPAGDGLGNGSQLWTYALPVPILHTPVSLGASNGYLNEFVLRDNIGELDFIGDSGAMGITLGVVLPPMGLQFTTSPTYVSSLGMIYVGRSDGAMQQITRNGAFEGGLLLYLQPGATIYGATADVESTACAPDRLVVAADGLLARLILPLPNCESGACAPTGCNSGFRLCGGSCIPTASCCTSADCPSVANGATACSGGSCVIMCNSGYTSCGGACLTLTDSNNCGGCGVACLAGQACCGMQCVGVLSDAANCGACGSPCSPGAACCNGTCTTLGTTTNCASCGNACAAGEDCCGMACASLSTTTNCGSCNNACAPVANAAVSCSSGACAVTCNSGYHLCGSDCVPTGGGCCTNADCPAIANGTNACSGGACALTCNAGFKQSGGACVACQTSADPVYAWSPHTTPTNNDGASAPAIKTAGGQSMSYFAQGNTVYAVRNVAEPNCTVGDCAAGGIRWTFQAPPDHELMETTSPPSFGTPLLGPGVGGMDSVFVTAGGVLYDLSANDGSVLLPFGAQHPVDTRRRDANGALVCTTAPSDQVRASLVSMVDTAGEFVIYVITYDGCNDIAQNRVYAYRASDFSLKWVLNGAPTHAPIDGGSICVPVPGTRRLYCGTQQETNLLAAPSLFAIDSETGLVQWSAPAGSIAQGLALQNGKLYVTTYSNGGSLAAYDPASGSPLWTTPLTFAAGITATPTFIPGAIVLLDQSGLLQFVADNGTGGVLMATVVPNGPFSYKGRPIYVPDVGRIYVGRSDGLIQQINPNGAAEAVATVVAGGTNVFEATADVESAACSPDRLVVAGQGSPGGVTRIILPLMGPPPAF
jgi:hypothetical protein